MGIDPVQGDGGVAGWAAGGGGIQGAGGVLGRAAVAVEDGVASRRLRREMVAAAHQESERKMSLSCPDGSS